jgi:type II secretion system protein I
MILRTGNNKKQGSGVRGQGSEKKLTSGYWLLVTKKGLTLIEVLLAVSILGFGIVGILRGYASSIAALEASQYDINAVNLLRAKMAEVELVVMAKEEISEESASGVFQDPFEDILWEWDIESTDQEDLYALTLTVSSEYNPRKFSLNTYVADKESDEDEEE